MKFSHEEGRLRVWSIEGGGHEMWAQGVCLWGETVGGRDGGVLPLRKTRLVLLADM